MITQPGVSVVARRGIRRTWLVGALVVLAFGLAACTSAMDPTDPVATTGSMSNRSPASGSTTAPSTSTSAAAPTTGTAGTGTYPADVPAAARANTTEGAKEFVKYYLEQLRIAFTTPRDGLLLPLSLASCQTCSGLEEDAVSYALLRHRYDQPPLNVLEISVDPDDQFETDGRLIDAAVHQNAAHVIDSNNNVVTNIVARDLVLVFTVKRVADAWAVAKVQVSG